MFCIKVINTFLSFIFAAGILWNAEGVKSTTWRLSHNHPLLKTVIDDEHPLNLRYVPIMAASFLYIDFLQKKNWGFLRTKKQEQKNKNKKKLSALFSY